MQKRRSISVGLALDKLLESGSAGALPVSTKLDVVAERYMEIMHTALPSFSASEWASVFISVRGLGRQSVRTLRPLLAHAVESQVARERDGKDVDRRTHAIQYRMSGLDMAAVVATIDLAERYWVEHDTLIGETELQEWLEQNK